MSFFMLELFTAHTLAPETYAERAYDALDSWKFPPDAFDEYEPIRNPWIQKADFVHFWRQQAKRFFGQVLIQRRAIPRYFADVLFQYGPPRAQDGKLPYHGFSVYKLPEKQFSGERQELLIELADRLFLDLGMDYGFLCLDEEYEAKNIVTNFVHSDGSVEPRHVVGMQWPRCIPGLYWINYFGNKYLTRGFAKALLHRDSTHLVRLRSGIRVIFNQDARFFSTAEGHVEEQALKESLGERWFYKNEWASEYELIETLSNDLASPPGAS